MKTPVPFSPQNLKYVSSLYRRALRTAHDWINRNDFYRSKAAEIRLRFEQNRNISDPLELRGTLEKTEEMLAKFKHPDPIIPPRRPGGIMYDRNAPPRFEKGPENFKNTV
ncbi:DEKNAAC102111 [Brettanomyces naardenensis]|uniref:NADH dehydrogenase [ubiquinone] 1 beta subcomplex subunit 9 n=1 Tax=Brettanomyces naardenensis TaxID=13370 RepID=A0A448YJR7_BRENA|nr:DEKNAAC102111 [Brettanomyces naardenensis]